MNFSISRIRIARALIVPILALTSCSIITTHVKLRPGKPLDALGKLIHAAYADISARTRTASR